MLKLRYRSVLETFLVASIVVSLLVSVGVTLRMQSLDPVLTDQSIPKFRYDSPKTNGNSVANQLVMDDPEREPISKILRQAGYDFYDTRLFTSDLLLRLPKWSDVMKLYGDPKIIGLDSCKKYQEDVPDLRKRLLGVAGLFNTGTHILHSLLMMNCEGPASGVAGILKQVPWGKHKPESYRTSQHRVPGHEGVNESVVLPVIVTRDPYTWMQSMCRQPYAAQFSHMADLERNLCPNIVPYPEDIQLHPRFKKMKYMPVFVQFETGFKTKYLSLVHFYNEWYNAYVNATSYPRVIVRMEDLIFHAEDVLHKLCNCLGGNWANRDPKKVVHQAEVANRNPGIDLSRESGLLRSVLTYGNRTLRRKYYQKIQLNAAKELLDPRLMSLFGYSYELPE